MAKKHRVQAKLERTDRGFAYIEFKDINGYDCSIQESSLATDNAIWLGCDQGIHVDGECCARMHLNREKVAKLIPVLQYFVKHGVLMKEDL